MTSLTPCVSIITPARNAAAYLQATIDSVREQSETRWELIIVDDGSSDHTADIARRAAAADPRVQAVSQDHGGHSAARNHGLGLARAEYALLLDADDVLANDALRRLLDALTTQPDAVAAYGPFRYFCGTPADQLPAAAIGQRPMPGGDLVPALLEANVIIAGGSVLFRTRTARDTGGLDESLVHGEDWDFWLRLALLGDFLVIGDPPVFFYRLHADSLSRAGGRRATDQTLLGERIFGNPTIQKRFDAATLARARRRFDANSHAMAATDALQRRRWRDARQEFSASLRHYPGKPGRWLLWLCSLLRYVPPPLARRLGM